MGTKIVERTDDRMVITVGAGALGWFVFFRPIGAVGILLIIVSIVGTVPGSGSSVFAGVLLVILAVFIGASYGAKIKTIAIDKKAGRIGIRSRWLAWGAVRAIDVDQLLEVSYRYGLYSNYPGDGLQFIFRDGTKITLMELRIMAFGKQPSEAILARHREIAAFAGVPYMRVPERRLLARGEGFGLGTNRLRERLWIWRQEKKGVLRFRNLLPGFFRPRPLDYRREIQ